MYKKYQSSWSLTKHKILMECELKCAIQYYIANRGQYETKPTELQLAWRLKHIQNLYLLFGSLVHQFIEISVNLLLETGEIISEEKLRNKLTDMLNQNYIKSKNGLNEWYKDPKSNPMLFEVYYEGGFSDSRVEFIKKRMDACIGGFIHSTTFRKLIPYVQIMEAERFRTFYLEGVKIVLSADLIYHDKDNGRYGIVDWKTGKQSTDDILQLALYTSYLKDTYNVDLSDIVVTNEYLEEGINKTYTLDTYEIDNLRNIVQESANRMAELENKLQAPDNQVLNAFQKTEDTNKCEQCNYKAICKDQYRNDHINKFLKGIGRIEEEKNMKKADIEMMREMIRSGMIVDEGIQDYVEENVYETEDSYRDKLERMSEYMMGH